MLKILKIMISIDEYQFENEKKSYSNQMKFLTYAKIIYIFIYIYIYIYVNCQTKTVSSMITKDA